jgi:hypothetical protein
MNKLKYLLVSGLAAASLFSCESVVADFNDNPNALTEVPVELVINHSLLNMASVGEADPARIACMWTDQMTGSDRQYISYDSYNLLAADFDAIWADIYQKGVAQAQNAEELAIKEGKSELAGVAQILQAYYFGEAAALFGDVPFMQVGKFTEFPSPAYEGQAAVLAGVQALLDKGIANTTSYTQGFGIMNTTSTWAKIGYALKARYYMVAKDYPQALTAAEAAGFEDLESSLDLKHSSANFSENLFWQFEVEQRGGYLTFSESYMKRLLDAASSDYRGNAKTNEAGRYAYYVAGDGVNINTSAGGAFAIDASFSLISFSEVQLIIAEAAARGGNTDKAITALNKVRNEWNRVAGAGSYADYVEADFNAGGIANTQNESSADALLREIFTNSEGR